MNKQGVNLTLTTIGVAVLVLITVFIVASSTNQTIAKGFGLLRDSTDGNSNPDNDGLITAIDDCPCEHGPDENQGCPTGTEKPKTPEAVKTARECLET